MKTHCADPHVPYGCTKSLEIKLAGVLGGNPHIIVLKGHDVSVNGIPFTENEYFHRFHSIYEYSQIDKVFL